jgi:peptidoglycan/LPS O-acetylase OafA/YrhL
MMFRVFNSERGIWACEIDAFMFYLAYLSLSFLFSFVFTLVFEKPVINLYKCFITGEKVFADHLYEVSPKTSKRVSAPELGRKYEPVLKSKDSNSTSSDGAESLD